MDAFRAIPIAGTLSMVFFVALPLGAWAFAVLAGMRAWKALASRPLSEPPQPGAGQRRLLYLITAADPAVFGLILAVLWRSVAEGLQAGGGIAVVDAGFGLLLSAGATFAWTAWIVAVSEALVFRKGLLDSIGSGFARVQAILVLPTLAALFALLLAFFGSNLAADVLSDPTTSLASRVDAVGSGFLAFSVALVAVPVASVLALRLPVTSLLGFRRGLLIALAGMVPSLAAFAWTFLLLTAS